MYGVLPNTYKILSHILLLNLIPFTEKIIGIYYYRFQKNCLYIHIDDTDNVISK
jgi:hypothetical protein